jgi:hypothetical protein
MTASVGERPLFTQLVPDAETFLLPGDATYVAGLTAEARSHHVESLQERCPSARFVDVADYEGGFTWSDGAGRTTVRARSVSELDGFWSDVVSATDTLLDITGLSHPTWAPLVGAAIRRRLPIKVVYVEPVKYRRNLVAAGNELFDLSKGFVGVSPLPGLVTLAEPDEDEFYFVPCLGFEGRRFSYLMEEVAPIGGHTIPIIGVPGFQPEFVAYAYDGNRVPLEDTGAWAQVRFATANDPFALFYELERIATRHPSRYLKIAPIGTKPHGLGAVLYALAHAERVEIVYDHPSRSDKRTEGAARLLIYDVAAFAAFRRIGVA